MGLAGYIVSKKRAGGKNFLSGGKSVGLIFLIGTIAANAIGTNSSIGATANGFRYGWAGMTLLIGLALGSLCMLIFVPTRKYGFLTIGEEIQFYYDGDRRIRQLVGLAFFIAGLSATMSSGSSVLVTSITILIEDVYPSFMHKLVPEKSYKKFSRVCIAITIVLSYLLSLYANDIVSFIVNVVGSFLPWVSVYAFMGRLWKRCTWQGGLANLVCGFASSLACILVPGLKSWVVATFTGPAILATVLSILVTVVVSLCTKKMNLTDEEKVALVKGISTAA